MPLLPPSMSRSAVQILDGPIGTELARRGVATPAPLWSAHALDGALETLAAIHRDYAEAGATVHTANTFRTAPWALERAGRGKDARHLPQLAVDCAREAVPSTHRVAGSIAPLNDCYRPDLSPPSAEAARAHARTAEGLARAGVDLILCETFPHIEEGLLALAAARATGLPVWIAFSPGPGGDLLEDDAILRGAVRAADLGAARVLVNCARPDRVGRLIRRLATAGVTTGGYGNVGRACGSVGWVIDGDEDPDAYAAAALRWVADGATVVGGCCGTTPAHIEALARALS